MGHSTVSCAKATEAIVTPFWMKTQVGPRNHVLDGVQIPQREGAILGGCSGHSKALAIFAAIKRDHSIGSKVVQQKGSFSMPDKCK